MELTEFEEILNCNENVVIYGAGIVAYGIKTVLDSLYQIYPPFYIVSDCFHNPESIGEIPVYPFPKVKKLLREKLVLIATPEQYHREISELLLCEGLSNFLCIDSHLEFLIMKAYYQFISRFSCLLPSEDDVISNSTNAAVVYMAISHLDKDLSRNYEIAQWVKKIQVGASLTDKRIGDLSDNLGDNISKENRLYGELTASYWIWKNDNHQIVGLYHYRRILLIDAEMLRLLQTKAVDVVLPLPFLCFQDTSWQYSRYLCEQDMQIVWQVLNECSPDYYEAARYIFKGNYLYNYNMLVARREIFQDYCQWLFPLLQEIKKRCERYQIVRKERYIGRIGEVLTSLYFLYNKKQWKIQHTEKKWLV